jgi:hypothetical protein
MRFPSCLVVALTVACARVDDSAKRVPEAWETAAGTRLHPIFVTASGGVRSFVAFEDRARGERCYPMDVGEVLACLPANLLPSLFADERCEQPRVAVDQSCDGAPKLVSVDGALFRSKPAARAFKREGSACVPFDPPAGTRVLVATDERVSIADHVAFTVRNVDVGARLRVRMLVGADGSRIDAGFHDTAHDAYCFFTKAADGTVRCLPFASPEYWDETCTFRVATYDFGRAAPAVVTTRPAGERCSNARVFRATDLGVIPIAFRDERGVCLPTTGSTPVVRLDEEIPPESFEAESRVKVGDSRLTQWVRTVGSAKVPVPADLDDSVLGAECRFRLDGGVYRCLPLGEGGSTFTDLACTQAAVCAFRSCDEQEKRFTVDRDAACNWTVHELGTPIATPKETFSFSEGRCLRMGGTCDEYFTPGAVIPRSSLASGNVVVE